MKTFTILAAASVLALSAGAASAQGWMSINQRQANLDARIDAGVRSGDLTRQEAVTLRGDFRAVSNLEATYRRNGLSNWERTDLDRRFDALSNRIRFERHDRDDRQGNGWMNINQRQANLDRRIDQGIRTGKITRAEAYRLRADFQTIARLENRYRANGLSNWERTDLDRRFDTLSARIRIEANDSNRYGAGYGQR
ncbi:MAG: hypothetical protein KA085_18525 [Phenylobacterium sp.]|uniref:hypothetical protein n=1 Tax=Phenylobacterium sp. TaxID=1871053 RepID=UPI001B59233D|nr:hypothetical protein [Phenylobacterium sp.]MBP7818119.1 hypothetical protein [Phenylobacterium sp.]MBP9229909.1 hypothetical protein [Phenylobacterium sp.]MBP9754064.1 hypothetical protein [Phenylobacterium sp.]